MADPYLAWTHQSHCARLARSRKGTHMHQSVQEFMEYSSRLVNYDGAHVVEVGAQDVNGRAADAVRGEPRAWIGIDLVEGPHVNYVGDAAVVLTQLAAARTRFDIAVSTEVLEHAENWREIVSGMLDVLVPGGALVLTCAGPGRPPHGAHGDPLPAADEWYENVRAADIITVLDGRADVVAWQEADGDTRVLAMKR